MSTTKIEWATKVWNPVTGCTKVSEGCKNCYAERFAKRLEYNPKTKQKYLHGFKPSCHPGDLLIPTKWKKPERVFVCSMGDLFHESIPFDFISYVFMIMSNHDEHTYMILTKRPKRMLEFYNWQTETLGFPWAAKPNVWLGISAENQTTFQERFEILARIPAAIRFVSFEPLLGPIEIKPIFPNKIDWVIAGGETGHGSRPSHPGWFFSLLDQCVESKTPFFFKGYGDWADSSHINKTGFKGLYPVYTFRNDEFMCTDVFRVGKKGINHTLRGQSYHKFPKNY